MASVRAHLRNNLVGYLALFFALTIGTAWAATELDKNSVKSKHIKNETVKDVDVKDGSITGGEVAESSLGKVPSAASADSATTAGNADMLGGIGSAAFGRTAFGSVNDVALSVGSDGEFADVVTTSITSGARPGFVVATGHLTAYTFEENLCPCQVEMLVRGPANPAPASVFADIPGTPDADDLGLDTASTTEVFPIAANTTLTLQLQAVVDDPNATGVAGRARLSATYVPFGATGGSSLSLRRERAASGAQPPRP